MKRYKQNFMWCTFVAYLVAPSITYSATLADEPLWLGTAVDHNIMLSIDDSGSMDFEVLFPNNDGTLYLGTDGYFANASGQMYVNGSNKYAYLFPNGYGRPYSGKRLYTDNHKSIPPIKPYAFARSADFNAAYYDPNQTYEPWPNYPGYTDESFETAEVTATKFEPAKSFGSETINLFTNINTSTKTDYWKFYIADDEMVCDEAGYTCGTGRRDYTYYPATYYVKVVDENASYFYSGQTRYCSSPTPAHYRQFVEKPGDFTNLSGLDALAYDGSCLKEYRIDGADDDGPFTNGGASEDALSRTTLIEEKQNFANWFQYYRRRHQAMRGGLAAAFEGVSGIRAGMFWINNRRSVPMRNMGVQSEVNLFLKEHFNHVEASGTPLRSALMHAGNQLMRTDNDAPIQYECQKNFTLLFTDGYNSQTSGSVGNSDGTAGAPYQDSESNTIADIAHHFYSTPLRTGTNFPAGKVVPPDECSDTENPLDPKMDCNTNLHMNTYMVGLGAKGTIYGNSVAGHTYLKVKDAYDAPPTWPGMGDRNPTQVDDLYHAAINGRGEMFNASTPALLGDALSSALKEIIESIGSSSSIAFTRGPDFTTGVGARAYPTLFDSKDWSGNLYAYTLDANGDLDALLWRDENGEAVGVQELLDQRALSGETARNILTMGVNGGVAFEWDNLTTAQKADLKTNSDGSTGTDSDGDARLDYLRGDMTVEGINLDTANEEKFRVRSHRLGDIMNSSPVFVGEPNARWPNKGKFGVDGDRYFDFQRTKADRSQMVYVGANDGMLHGFNAEAYDASSNPDAGQEVFAYIPSMAYSSETKEGLHYLTSSEYNHRAYVNMPSVVSDVHIYTDQVIVPDSTSRSWRTVLIGGMGNGGKGIFALDVTEPDNISESDQEARDTVLWEFSSDNIAAADQDDFGYLNGQPEIVMMNNGKWAAVFGNGYNSDAEKAKLFIVYIEQGIDGAWSTGDYQVLDTNNETSNGLSMALPYDSDGDMVVDRIYAGDLQGNMWVFDVSSDNSTNWGSAYRNSGINIPLFTATDASNKRQPITAAPRLAKHDSMPDLNNGENILVTFGTGSYVFEGDDSDQSVQTYYTIWDNSESQDTTVTKAKLAERTKSIARVVNDEPLFTSTGTPINWASDLGWYMDFTVSGVAKGERLDTSPLLGVDLNGEPIAVFSSIQPEDSACAKGGGDGFIYNVSLLDGFTPDAPVIDLDGDGDIDSSDNVLGKQSQTMLNELTTFGKNIYGSSRTSSDVFKLKSNLGGEIREGRMGWYEL